MEGLRWSATAELELDPIQREREEDLHSLWLNAWRVVCDLHHDNELSVEMGVLFVDDGDLLGREIFPGVLSNATDFVEGMSAAESFDLDWIDAERLAILRRAATNGQNVQTIVRRVSGGWSVRFRKAS